ncbi:MAG TPA: hypothetical protein PLQ88_10920 [Blastocatellia bacterium]|nr:hypothetical protein [Blastocatellia bacterium]
MSKRVFWLLVGITLLLTPIANAQPGRPGGPPGVGGPPGGAQFELLLSEVRFGGKVVKGAPYSAVIVTENIQVLADGTRITNKGGGKFYRDTEGRTRLERTLTIGGPFVISGDAPKVVFIYDPVAGVNYMLDEGQHIARKFSPPPNAQSPGPAPTSSVQEKVEALGRQMIEGVEAEGTRTTVTIPIGQIGNDRLIEIVSERWEATELKVIVLSKHKDPRLGEVIYRLTNINRGEQPKTLFEVPANYKIFEGGPMGPPMRGGRRPSYF